MKSKLSVALAAAGCVLAVSPANAVTVTSHRGAITSSVPGAVLFDDFDSVQNTAIGTITGGLLCSGVDFGCGGLFGTPPATGNFLGVVSVDFTTTIATLTSAKPVSYAGFAWGTSDFGNKSMCMMVLLFSAHFLATQVCDQALVRSQPISTFMLVQERLSLSLS